MRKGPSWSRNNEESSVAGTVGALTQIDSSYPLKANIDWALSFYNGSGLPSDVTGNTTTSSEGAGSLTWSIDPTYGSVATYNSSIDTTHGTTVGNYTSNPWSIAFWLNIPDLTTSFVLFSKGSFNTNGWYIQVNETAGSIKLHSNASGSHSIVSQSTALVASTWYHIVFSASGSTCSVFVNGVDNTGSNSYQAMDSDTTDPLRINDYPGGGFRGSPTLSSAVLFNTNISVSQALYLYDNPNEPFASGAAAHGLFRAATLSLGSGGPFFQSPANG